MGLLHLMVLVAGANGEQALHPAGWPPSAFPPPAQRGSLFAYCFVAILPTSVVVADANMTILLSQVTEGIGMIPIVIQ